MRANVALIAVSFTVFAVYDLAFAQTAPVATPNEKHATDQISIGATDKNWHDVPGLAVEAKTVGEDSSLLVLANISGVCARHTNFRLMVDGQMCHYATLITSNVPPLGGGFGGGISQPLAGVPCFDSVLSACLRVSPGNHNVVLQSMHGAAISTWGTSRRLIAVEIPSAYTVEKLGATLTDLRHDLSEAVGKAGQALVELQASSPAFRSQLKAQIISDLKTDQEFRKELLAVLRKQLLEDPTFRAELLKPESR